MNMMKCPCLCEGQAQAPNHCTFPPSQEDLHGRVMAVGGEGGVV